MNRTPGVSTASFGESARSIDARMLAAVTGAPEGGANLRPARTVKLYVLSPFETRGIAVARSGRSVVALCAGSEYASSVEHVARSTRNPHGFHASAGSAGSKTSRGTISFATIPRSWLI